MVLCDCKNLWDSDIIRGGAPHVIREASLEMG